MLLRGFTAKNPARTILLQKRVFPTTVVASSITDRLFNSLHHCPSLAFFGAERSSSSQPRYFSSIQHHRSLSSKDTITMRLSSSDAHVTSSHYEGHSARSYEQAYFYEAGAYQQYLVELVQDRLQLVGGSFQQNNPRHILDIGGGTGNFAQALLENDENNKSKRHRITVVDPFLDPTSTTNLVSDQVFFVKASAEAFMEPSPNDIDNDDSSWRVPFHQVLMKEVVHHLDHRVDIFRGMFCDLQVIIPSTDTQEKLATPPSLLIITRPQIEIDYPLWDAARDVWKQNQPSSEELSKELHQAGFVDIQTTLESYPCQISISRWQSMIRQRFWSTFSNFTDEELESATNDIAITYQDRIDVNGILHFEDRLLFITARKEV